MSTQPFDSPDTFRAAFAQGLGGLLCEDCGLGAYILVFNNAAFDAGLRAALGPALAGRFAVFSAAFQEALKRGADPAEPPDDVAVFLRMMAVGYGGLAPVDLRRAGPWELQFNPVRAFRPARSAGERLTALRRPFDPSTFHFNKPFLRLETFWSGNYEGRRLDFLFNKFPFVELQTIVVPDREFESPQFLTRADHDLAWSLTGAVGESMPGVVTGYNSLGAFASINHLHFHLTPRERPLPLMEPAWRHNGGSADYPIPCQVFDRCGPAWKEIDALQRRDQAFNLLYAPGRLYCLPRRHQGDYTLPGWCGGQAWYELAGGFICFDAARFQLLQADEIRATMAAAAMFSLNFSESPGAHPVSAA
jgi:diadenosine tetraphosphate (Ap4A) HIT family hydrolase